MNSDNRIWFCIKISIRLPSLKVKFLKLGKLWLIFTKKHWKTVAFFSQYFTEFFKLQEILTLNMNSDNRIWFCMNKYIRLASLKVKLFRKGKLWLIFTKNTKKSVPIFHSILLFASLRSINYTKKFITFEVVVGFTKNKLFLALCGKGGNMI